MRHSILEGARSHLRRMVCSVRSPLRLGHVRLNKPLTSFKAMGANNAEAVGWTFSLPSIRRILKGQPKVMGAKSHETLTPPLKSPRALISLGKIEIGGVILRVQP